MTTQTQAPKLKCQTNGPDLKGFNVNSDTSTLTINAKPMGTISVASMSTGTQNGRIFGNINLVMTIW